MSLTRRKKRHPVVIPQRVLDRFNKKCTEFRGMTNEELNNVVSKKLSSTDKAAWVAVLAERKRENDPSINREGPELNTSTE